MTHPRHLNCYDYATVDYDRVREILGVDASGLFHRATVAAARRVEEIVSTLHVSVGPIDVAADVKIDIRRVVHNVTALGDRSTLVELSWTAARSAKLFPVMDAMLTVYPLSRAETQLDLVGYYHPPLGVVGNVIDAVVGHRLARASVLRFVQEVARQIESEVGR